MHMANNIILSSSDTQQNITYNVPAVLLNPVTICVHPIESQSEDNPQHQSEPDVIAEPHDQQHPNESLQTRRGKN